MFNEIIEPDLEYHKQVIKMMNDALAIRNHWYGYLALKYKLKGQDAIDELGKITRVETNQ